jgi:tol-pal system protein YbgF
MEEEFDTAMNLLARAQYDRASEAFRIFADNHPDSELAPHALYWTGDIAYSTRRDYADAARQFAELLKEYPQAPRAAESMLKLGLSLLALGQKQEGCAALAALPARYPNAGPTILNRSRAEIRAAACG